MRLYGNDPTLTEMFNTSQSGKIPSGDMLKIQDSNGDTIMSIDEATGDISISNLTDGYVPYSDNGVLTDSPIYMNGTNVGVGTTILTAKLGVQTVGYGDSDQAFKITGNNGNSGLVIGHATGDINAPIILTTFSGEDIYFGPGNSSLEATPDVVFKADGNVLIGTTINNTGKLQVLSTTEQLKLQYDTSNYASFTVGSDGTLTVAPSGDFVFNPTGNIGIGVTEAGDSAKKVLVLGNGTAPTTSPADAVQLYAEDVSSSSELKVRDEAGNITTLSPHSPIWPENLEVSEIYPQVHVDRNDYLGVERFIAVCKMAELVQQLAWNAGLLSKDKKIVEYNFFDSVDWDQNQQAIKKKRDDEINKVVERQMDLQKIINHVKMIGNYPEILKRYEDELGSLSVPKPYNTKPMPDWMAERVKGE